jgi:hypothetical protein
MKTFNESNTLILEGLPPKDVQITLAHLVKPYEGIQEYQALANGTSATVKFSSHEEAKFALAGTTIE